MKRLSRRSADGEAGFTTVELMAALSVMAFGFFALAGALGFGLQPGNPQPAAADRDGDRQRTHRASAERSVRGGGV